MLNEEANVIVTPFVDCDILVWSKKCLHGRQIKSNQIKANIIKSIQSNQSILFPYPRKTVYLRFAHVWIQIHILMFIWHLECIPTPHFFAPQKNREGLEGLRPRSIESSFEAFRLGSPRGLMAGTTCPHGGFVQVIFLFKWVICRFRPLILQGEFLPNFSTNQFLLRQGHRVRNGRASPSWLFLSFKGF